MILELLLDIIVIVIVIVVVIILIRLTFKPQIQTGIAIQQKRQTQSFDLNLAAMNPPN